MNPKDELSTNPADALRRTAEWSGDHCADVTALTSVPSGLATAPDQELRGRATSSMSKLVMLLPFDPLRAVDALWKNTLWCVVGGILLAAGTFIAARSMVEPHFTATAQLVRQDLPDSYRASEVGESFKPRQIPMAILTATLMRGGELLDRVAKQTQPPTAPGVIRSGLVIGVERNSDLIRVSYTSDVSSARATSIANIYTDEVVKFTKSLQMQDAEEFNSLLKQKIAQYDAELMRVNEELLRFFKDANLLNADKEMDAYLSELTTFDLKVSDLRSNFDTLDIRIQTVEKEMAKVSPTAARLARAREDLGVLLTRYTEQNPLVEEHRERIANLEEELKQSLEKKEFPPPREGEGGVAESLYLQRIDLLSQKQMLAEQLKKTEATRKGITDKLSQLPRKSMDYAQIKARSHSLELARQLLASRQREAELYMENSPGSYRVLAAARPEDAVSDPRRSKKLMVSAAGSALGFLVLAAYFMLRELADRRMKSPNDMLRITRLPVLASLPEDVGRDPAAQEAWAFRTWTRLQSQLGVKDRALVCGLLSEHECTHGSPLAVLLADAAAWRGASALIITSTPPPDRPSVALSVALNNFVNEADSWLEGGRGVMFLQVDAMWTWSAEQRAQLERALALWSRRPAAVIFIELPPASRPESLLMAEKIPQCLWVGESGQKPSVALHEVLATYRHAGCRVVGSLMQRVPRLKPQFLSDLAGATAALMIGSAWLLSGADTGHAQEIPLSVKQPEVPVSATTVSTRPAPANAYRLGPGDSVNLMLFGLPESVRKDVTLKPDGRITYLEAQDMVAAGLTLDELRLRLNEVLSTHYQRPRVMVTPFAFRSCHIYVLGKVVKKGMVPFDRPLTLLEAVAEAGGLETGLYMQNTVELADLGRSILARGGRRVDVDFEALFARGDMTQNVPLEADDYIYFPSANNNEIYMVGNVRSQGAQGLLGHSSVTSAIALAGGFTDRAFRERILIVRGSLDKPQAILVNMSAILQGKEKGVRLEPNDIVFVADKPWAVAEDLLDLAITSFIQGAVTGYAGGMAPLIKDSFIQSDRR